MSESLMVIRTYGNLLSADEAQIELLSAGIYSLLFSDDAAPLDGTNTEDAIALAVHQRDADIAESLLTPLVHTG